VAAGAEAVDSSDTRYDQVSRLEENLEAVNIKLTTDDLREIDSSASEIKVEGARYPEYLQKMVGR
jgi:diketogulonate reductase-like aldo/keto reductase